MNSTPLLPPLPPLATTPPITPTSDYVKQQLDDTDAYSITITTSSAVTPVTPSSQHHVRQHSSSSDLPDEEDSTTATTTPTNAFSPRIGGVTFDEDEGRVKGDSYIDSDEAQNNFYKDRIQLIQITQVIDTTKTFVFKEHFKREKKQNPVGGKAIKNSLVEEVEQLNKEPNTGLFPPDFDEKVIYRYLYLC
jgi:hypothetical protein